MSHHFKRNWQILNKQLEGKQSLIVWFVICCILVVSFIAFTPSYIRLFLTDDFKHLGFVQPFVEKPYTIYKLFNPYTLGWYYRPTQLLFFTIFRLFWGLNPIPYYIGLLMLHAINIVLVYKVARIWGNSRLGAIFAAGLFSVIATHQEAVGWISAVSILLAATFSLLSIYSLRVYLNNSRQIKYLIIALSMAVFAMLSREEAVVMAPLVLLIWVLSIQRRPQKAEISLFIGFGLLVSTYIIFIFLRPTWTPHANATLSINIENLASIQNLSKYLLFIIGSYFSTEDMQITVNWLTIGLLLCTLLLIGLAMWRGSNLLRLGILWTTAFLLFLYITVWLLSGSIAYRYLYLPWIGVALSAGTITNHFHRKYPTNPFVPSVASLVLIAVLISQTTLSRQRQQSWHDDATTTANNLAMIKELMPEINENSHIFAYHMPPVTDYIQSMAAVSYDIKLGNRGGEWKRLLKSGFATPNDHLFNYEEGLIFNVMPELQEHEQTVFIWQENPIAETIRLDGTQTPLDLGAYELNQIVGPPEQQRFGFFIHPPAPEDGWASLAYTTTVPNNSDLMVDVYKNWGQVAGEDGISFQINIVDAMEDTKTIFQTSLDTSTNDWAEIKLPMDEYWQQTILLQFQVNANENFLHDHAYWANPRFVVDTSTNSPE